MADLANTKDDLGKKRYDDLTAALVGMFNAMSQGFIQRQLDFLQGDVRRTVKQFLVQFDAIFTLNQDTLIELHYLDQVVSEKWNGIIIPGVKPLGSATAVPAQLVKIAPHQPDADNFKLPPRIQPYIKLHGSCNWNDGTSGGRILIMGGQKAISIDQFPILTWYHQQFREFLLRPDARLMVIRYSFSDVHINKAIGDGVERGLKLFIIDPCGVDVLDKRPKVPLRSRDEYMDKLTPNIIGASRRPLTSIFFDDVVEHGRVMKFFV